MRNSMIDINLLAVFDALMAEGQVTAAAKRLGMSQPGMSRALLRLRQQLGDELFVRTRKGMIPTPRAISLATPIREALIRLDAALRENSRSESSLSEHIFTLGMSNYAATALSPRLIGAMPPHIDIRIRSLGAIARQLDEDELDLACGVFDKLPPRIATATIAEDRWVCVGHPYTDLAEYLTLGHVLVEVEGYDAVARLCPRRRIALTLPDAAALPGILAGSELVALVPGLMAESLGLASMDPPFATPAIRLVQAWHRRREADAPLTWLRGQIQRLQ